MRNSLIFKLMGAFLLVVAIGAIIIFWLTSRATQNAFNLYATRNGQALAQRLSPILAEYYSTNMSWQGVDTFLQSQLSSLLRLSLQAMVKVKDRGLVKGMVPALEDRVVYGVRWVNA